MTYYQLGDKYTLWITESSEKAYVDQMGIAHRGNIVLKSIVVTVTNVRTDVPDMWITKNDWEGIQAVDDKGTIFSCNWEVFPSDSSTPTFYWDCMYLDGKIVRPIDAVQAYNFDGLAYVMNGERAKPIGDVNICQKHNRAYYIRGDCLTLRHRRNNCWECDHTSIY